MRWRGIIGILDERMRLATNGRLIMKMRKNAPFRSSRHMTATPIRKRTMNAAMMRSLNPDTWKRVW